MLIYVDDIIVIGNNSSLISCLIQKLHSAFSLKKLGKLEYFYRVHMDESKGISTPIVGGLKLSKADTNCFEDPTLY
jgi:hypothetical protein